MQIRTLLTVLFSLVITSCSVRDSAPSNVRLDPDKIRDAVPVNEPFSRYGNPESYEVMGKTYHVMKSNQGFVQKGEASWYGTKFHGRKTSSGEEYDMYAMTAAHKTLPLPTYVEVRNLENEKKVIVKVNDRGPFHDGRIIDLSYAAATKLGITGTGTGPVEIRTINTSGLDLSTASSEAVSTTDAGNSKIHVQVAAFTGEQQAEKMATDLRDKRFKSVRVYVAQLDGQKFYRVRIGPIPNMDLAYRVLRNLNDIGHDAASVLFD
ncbi:MAG: septal ring lytic transglycosylase RlpA family protein [Gammaproteobacteria bacterium]|nr:septal ring lytic transglycosylase RlpA family protein [Gammaproteobacteria bacterium]